MFSTWVSCSLSFVVFWCSLLNFTDSCITVGGSSTTSVTTDLKGKWESDVPGRDTLLSRHTELRRGRTTVSPLFPLPIPPRPLTPSLPDFGPRVICPGHTRVELVPPLRFPPQDGPLFNFLFPFPGSFTSFFPTPTSLLTSKRKEKWYSIEGRTR